MGETHINIDSDVPVEWDCGDCGAHHVIDPRTVRRIVERRRFRCGYCGRRRRKRELVGLAIGHDGNLAGACVNCRPT